MIIYVFSTFQIYVTVYFFCHVNKTHRLYLNPIAISYNKTMAGLNENGSLPIQPFSDAQASILDFFFPGFTRVSTATQYNLSIDLSVYASLLCFFGLFVFTGHQIYKYLSGLVQTYYSKNLPCVEKKKRLTNN